MATPLEQTFADLQSSGKMGLITHVIGGFPDRETTVPLICAMEEAGASVIELQIPFSDPTADGPVMMEANTHALEQGITVKDCFAMVREARKKTTVPLLLMTYVNVLFSYGMSKFVHDAAAAGADGFIVPDLSVEEADEYLAACRETSMHPVFLISPNITPERLEVLVPATSGFIYCTSRMGTTGVQDTLAPSVQEYLALVRKHTPLPRAVGFGISKPEHVAALRGHAECAIVGSAVIRILKETSPAERLDRVKEFLVGLMK